MTVPRALSIPLLIVTVLPVVYFAVFFVSFFSDSATGTTELPLFGSFDTLLTLHLLTALLLVAIPVFYVTHAFNNKRLPSDKRLLWVIVLIFGSSLSALAYWFHYIWKRPVRNDEGDAPRRDSALL